MRYTVERNFVQVVGRIWWPPDATCAAEYPLRNYDIENIGEFTRENVERWLGMNAGDFSYIEDFRASVGSEEIPWKREESELTFNDCMFPEPKEV